MINDIGNNIKRSKQVKVCSSVLYSTHVNLPRGKPGLYAPMKVRYKFNIAFLKGSLIKGPFTKAFTATFFKNPLTVSRYRYIEGSYEMFASAGCPFHRKYNFFPRFFSSIIQNPTRQFKFKIVKL